MPMADANAVACARGVYRVGCAGARGAVVVGPSGPPLRLGPRCACVLVTSPCVVLANDAARS
jgi:hypothetical protein